MTRLGRGAGHAGLATLLVVSVGLIGVMGQGPGRGGGRGCQSCAPKDSSPVSRTPGGTGSSHTAIASASSS
jgi:hypothetical protein